MSVPIHDVQAMDRVLNLNNALAIATAVFFYKSLTPPNTPLASNEWMVRNWFERTIQIRTIKPDHQLVTSGPYSFVRHPSYTGIFASFIGATIYMYSPGHWLRACGSSSNVGMAVSVMWGLNFAICFYGLGTRMGAEDEGLRRRFGKEWDEFAQRVPCRLIPGIY